MMGTYGFAGSTDNLKIFAGRHNRPLAESVCAQIGIRVGEARTNVFPDGELLIRLEEDVRGRDCYVVISTCQPVNDNLLETLIFCDCLKRASAERVTVVMPYFGYGRQDRKDQGRVPITAKLVANMITAARADRVLAVDLHAAQIQGFFDLPMDHLSATPLFRDYFEGIRDELGELCLVSPDVGNVKVAEGVANLLDADLAIINKKRLSGTEITTGHIIGSVEGKTVLMIDDMISTAGTVCEAARVVTEQGARDVMVAATHPLLVGKAIENIHASPISRVVVSNTVPLPPDKVLAPIAERIVQLDIGPLVGEAIHRIHNNASVSALFEGTVITKL
ncbi:MAG: ribose-phosphate pyrophosphokinase [Planctomycetota bacterium]